MIARPPRRRLEVNKMRQHGATTMGCRASIRALISMLLVLSAGGANPLSRAALEGHRRQQTTGSDGDRTAAGAPPMDLYPNEPWPLPRTLEVGSVTVRLGSDLSIESSSDSSCAALGSSSIFQAAVERYTPLLRPPAEVGTNLSDTAQLTRVSVCVISASEHLGLDTNSSYTLHVPADGGSDIALRAETIYGFLHALESLQQLTRLESPGVIATAPVTIRDKPEFPMRGLMINPSIQFLPLGFLKHIVDGLALNKANYLHIHFTDISAFTIDSPSYPSLAGKGAYHAEAKYTPAMLRELVAYAKQRGVRIIPEIGRFSVA